MADDYADSAATTGVVPVGGSTTGSIETSNDVDWLAVTLTAGTTYRFDLISDLRNPSFYLFDSAGQPARGDTDGYPLRITYTAPSTGTYYLQYNNISTDAGTYTVSATALGQLVDDYADSAATTGVVPVGGSTTGNIETSNDVDWLAVTLTAGTTYRFDLISDLRNPSFYLFDSAGQPARGDTDGYPLRITYTAPSTGTYYLQYNNISTDAGTYTVSASVLSTTPNIILNDMATTNEDTPVNILVQGNDTFESTPAITAITNGAHGTVSINDNGSAGNTADDFVVYTPTADFNGTDTFTYTATSGGVTETATVSVTINPVQDALDDTVTVAHNSGAHPINVLANDFFEGTEQIAAVTQGTSGTVAINDNGTAGNTADDFVTYTPNTGFFGTDTFTYTVTSPTGTAETATVSVSVSPDVAPTAVTDSCTVGEDAAIAIDVLANDTDPDGGPKVTTTASDPAHGTVVLTGGSPGANTGLTYQPDADFNGTDTFTYTLYGGSTTTVTVTVTPVADIVNDAVTVNEDSGTNNLNLLANDTFENPGRSITAVGTATHGTTAINNNATPGDITDDFVVYTPATDFNGTDSFTYTVTSPAGVTETASATATISAVTDIVNDIVTIAQDSGAHNLDLLANDTFENPVRSITSVGAAAHGTTTINDNGTAGNTADDFVVYTPAAGYNGPDTFTYTVTSSGVAESATVSVTVTAPPPSTTPTSGNDDITGTEGPDTIAALAGDDIIDGLGAGDLLLGNQGNDTVFGRTGNDTIWGGQGNDSLDGAEDTDFLWGNEGADTLVGGDGANTIVGGQDSSDAADSITAGSGPDLIWGNGGADTITADGGGNTVIGGFGGDSIVTGSADDIIFGNQDSDTISGSDGANLIFGGFGDDSILTGSGNDTIWGNEGNDTMAAGTGADRYVFLIGSGNDQISGFVFGEGDRLDLQGQTFTRGTSGDGDALLLLSGGGTIELNGVAPAGFSPTFVL